MQYSGPGQVLFRSRVVLQASSLKFQIQTDNKDVNTLAAGRAGHSPGAKKVQIQVENAVPAAGMEVDWPGLALAQAEVPIGVRIAGKTYECSGDLRDVDMDSSVDQPNKVSWTFHGIITATI